MIFRPKSNCFEIKILCPQGFSIIIFWLDYSSFHHRLCPAQLFRLLRTKCRFIKQVSGRSGKLSGSITFAQSFRCITSPLMLPFHSVHQVVLQPGRPRGAGCWVPGCPQARPSPPSVITYISASGLLCLKSKTLANILAPKIWWAMLSYICSQLLFF